MCIMFGHLDGRKRAKNLAMAMNKKNYLATLDPAVKTCCFLLQDATCCVWNYDGKVIQKFKGHKVGLIFLVLRVIPKYLSQHCVLAYV